MEQVRIWEEKVIIPTYEVGEPDKNPMFLEKRVYQGSTGKVYPYPTTEKIANEKKDKSYTAVYLENKYIKVMILPELGGRIQRAYDKISHFDFVYYNHVVKPALVGLLGPWISGGIEFNWPQHHRPTTFRPVDHLITENADGSKTLWVNDVDQMYGTKGAAKFTLYPDKSYIEIEGQLYNRTALPQSFLWWANPAFPANDYTQSIFPPDVHAVYDHGKRDVSRFPIATGEYYKYDYSDGVDISRYKNLKVPTSYMAEKSKYDFVGAYDHHEEAGILHVADHNISPGKKQWTWGCGDFGKVWDKNLTDEDGSYIELMTGVFTDNQPDFTWMKPLEEKTFTQYFMPYRKLSNVKNASTDAVINIIYGEKEIRAEVYATSVFERAQLRIRLGDALLFEEDMSISPENIFTFTFENKDYDIHELYFEVLSEGKTLVSYIEEDQGIPEKAEPAQAAKDPEDCENNEILYLTGQHIEQYRHATFLPEDYYLEGLKRDEFDTRLNNAYGALLLRRGMFAESEGYFKKALKRLTKLNPNPYNGEPYYNLGLAYFYQEKFEKAYEAFYKASWSQAQRQMSYYYLSLIKMHKKEYVEAKSFTDMALSLNSGDIKSRALSAVILRKLDRKDEAKEQLLANIAYDPFDYVSHFELAHYFDEAHLKTSFDLMRRDHETFLQIARDYNEAACYEEALQILSYDSSAKPLTYYYTAYNLFKLGRDNEACEALRLAEKADPAYTFPNKPEDIAVLKTAIRKNPEGSKAQYYLGNLYYDKRQYKTAAELWEDSAAKDSSFPTVYRNLAIAYYNKENNIEKAIAALKKAFALDKTDARVFLELIDLLSRTNIDAEKMLELLEENKALLSQRDDVLISYVKYLNLNGKYEEALKQLQAHIFHPWEGAEGRIPLQYKLALINLAKQDLADGKPEAAAQRLESALVYPENFNEGKLEGTKDNHIHYYLGEVYSKLGKKEKAKEHYELATEGHDEPAGVKYYYDQPADMILFQGLAYEKLGDQKEANKRYYRLIDYGEDHLKDKVRYDYFAVSIPDFQVFDEDISKSHIIHCYYLMGLGNIGIRNFAKAEKFFKKVLELDAHHQDSLFYKENGAMIVGV